MLVKHAQTVERHPSMQSNSSIGPRPGLRPVLVKKPEEVALAYDHYHHLASIGLLAYLQI